MKQQTSPKMAGMADQARLDDTVPSDLSFDPDVPRKAGTYNIDFHVHTTASLDGRSDVKQLVAAAKRRGLDAICVCDHNLFSQPRIQCMDGVVVLGGCECSTDAGHILALFCNTSFDCTLPKDGTLPSAKEVVARIHAHGGIAVLAHPFAKQTRMRQTLLCGADGVETINARACFHHAQANAMARQFAVEEQLFQTGGSDAHGAVSVGDAYTEVTLLEGQTLRQALLAHQCRALRFRLTPRVQKGLSQWKKICHRPTLFTLVRGGCYLMYCVILDLFSPQKDADVSTDTRADGSTTRAGK